MDRTNENGIWGKEMIWPRPKPQSIMGIMGAVSFLVSWHITQWVPSGCPQPINDISQWTGHDQMNNANSGWCYKKVETSQSKLFDTKKEADDFITTKPNQDYQDAYHAKISDVKIEEFNN